MIIAYFKLTDWWLITFTGDERKYIESKQSLTKGKIVSISITASEYLSGLETWFSSADDNVIKKKIHDKVIDLGNSNPIAKPGYYKGRHYTTYILILKK